ncbi:hypothetical protein BN1723_004557, partial [Verticillium longisporum]
MKIRESLISRSILKAIAQDESDTASNKSRLHHRVIRLVLAFFALFKLFLTRYRRNDFASLRECVWKLDEREYLDSFRLPQSSDGAEGQQVQGKKLRLKPVGDLGYSGSTFFTTPNSKYLIKSLPRRFEHTFFTHDLFDPYVDHMRNHPHSLLVRIADMVYTPHPTLGGIIGTAPTHHIIMENLLYGKQESGDDWHAMKWETYDLKPSDYFFPERDIADGNLAPQSVKDKLIDEFPDRVKVDAKSKKKLIDILSLDTQLLADNNAIDYSLFLVRYPGPNTTDPQPEVVNVKSEAELWRTGMTDSAGLWTYRVVVLDFFWARHKFHAQAMTGLVKLFNKVAHKGPMSITANPTEYRERFLNMVDAIVVEV